MWSSDSFSDQPRFPLITHNHAGAQPAWRAGEISEDELELLRQVRVLVNRQYLPWRGEVGLGERERLTFEIDTGDVPLDIYQLTLELERDEVSQGIPVE